MIRTYFKHRKKATGEPPQRFEQLPPVTIQLPLYNERYVVERLIDEVAQDRVSARAAADSGAGRFHRRYRIRSPRRWCERYQRRRATRSNTITAPIAHGFKAGALQEGLKTATGEFVAIFDADFIPPRDFLTRTVHYFADPKVGVVQTRWSYLNRDYNFLTEVEAMLLDGHFILEHGARSRRRAISSISTARPAFCARTMIDDAGGWQHDTLTEDSDLSYRAQLKGWRFVYLPGSIARRNCRWKCTDSRCSNRAGPRA